MAGTAGTGFKGKKAGEKDACKYNAVCYLEGVARYKGGRRSTAFFVMIFGLIITGVLGGIAALVLFEAIGEARGSSGKLHDRYHE
jgi:hypothetical protein